MDLTKLGWNADLNRQFAPHHAKGLVPARVAVEDKHFFRVWTANAELLAQVTGKCFHDARRSNSNLPKVGDWVAVKLVPNEEKAVIQAILPRRTKLCRTLTGRGSTEHILATNIDTAFMVTAADSTFDTVPLVQTGLIPVARLTLGNKFQLIIPALLPGGYTIPKYLKVVYTVATNATTGKIDARIIMTRQPAT